MIREATPEARRAAIIIIETPILIMVMTMMTMMTKMREMMMRTVMMRSPLETQAFKDSFHNFKMI